MSTHIPHKTWWVINENNYTAIVITMVTRQTTLVKIPMATEYKFLRSTDTDQDQKQMLKRIWNVFHTHLNIWFILKQFRFCIRFRSV